MKKNYIKPVTHHAEVETQALLSTSRFSTDGVDNQVITISEEETDVFNARTYHSVWDEE